MDKRFGWTLYWGLTAIALIAGLDNLIFQPAMPGMIIGLSDLVTVTAMIAMPLMRDPHFYTRRFKRRSPLKWS